MDNYLNPPAKWQRLIADYAGLPDVARMHYAGARAYLDERGIALVFGNTVKLDDGRTVYLAVVEFDRDWVAFVTEAAAAWRPNVERFTLVLRGKARIEALLLPGWTGAKMGQREAKEIAAAVLAGERETAGTAAAAGVMVSL